MTLGGFLAVLAPAQLTFRTSSTPARVQQVMPAERIRAPPTFNPMKASFQELASLDCNSTSPNCSNWQYVKAYGSLRCSVSFLGCKLISKSSELAEKIWKSVCSLRNLVSTCTRTDAALVGGCLSDQAAGSSLPFVHNNSRGAGTAAQLPRSKAYLVPHCKQRTR